MHQLTDESENNVFLTPVILSTEFYNYQDYLTVKRFRRKVFKKAPS